jgi:hypothetical protein
MNILARLLVRKDVEAWLENHSAAVLPLLEKIMPFLEPSLTAWAKAHPGEIAGIACDCILKFFDRHSLASQGEP